MRPFAFFGLRASLLIENSANNAKTSNGLTGAPDAQRAVWRHILKIIVGAQQQQLVANAQLRKKSVYRSDLNPSAPAGVAKLRSLDMVLSVWG